MARRTPEHLHHRRAAVDGVSLHAAALSVLSVRPSDDLRFVRPSAGGRHLSAVPTTSVHDMVVPDDRRHHGP